MDDLISRRAAAQTALEFMVEYFGGAFDEDLQKKLIERINALSSAQPEIVRCKDCKHKPKHPPEYDYGHYLEFPDDICPCQCEDPWHSMKPEDNFFCAKGERNNE